MKLLLRKSLLVIMALSMLLAVTPALASAAAKIVVTVQVDGKTVNFPDAKPYFEDSRVLIPIRFVSEALGAKVDYKKETVGSRVDRVVYVEFDGKKIRMLVNSSSVLVGDEIVKLDVPARVQGSRVFIPLRFVSEALGAKVEWNQSKKLVSISTGEKVIDPDPAPDDDNMYGTEFEWKAGYTDLAKELFANNMKVSDGKLTFTVPEGAEADKGYELTPGKTYTFEIGKGKGYISFSKVYPGRDEQEVYTVSLDSSGNEDLEALFGGINDVVVVGNNLSAAPLSEVLKLAQKLK